MLFERTNFFWKCLFDFATFVQCCPNRIGEHGCGIQWYHKVQQIRSPYSYITLWTHYICVTRMQTKFVLEEKANNFFITCSMRMQTKFVLEEKVNDFFITCSRRMQNTASVHSNQWTQERHILFKCNWNTSPFLRSSTVVRTTLIFVYNFSKFIVAIQTSPLERTHPRG